MMGELMQRVEEVFVRIPGFEQYAVSNYGWVINAKHNRDIKPRSDNGHTMVRLYSAGIQYRIHVDELVAQAFFVDYDEFAAIVHISGDMGDNCVTNLHLIDGHVPADVHWCDRHERWENNV